MTKCFKKVVAYEPFDRFWFDASALISFLFLIFSAWAYDSTMSALLSRAGVMIMLLPLVVGLLEKFIEGRKVYWEEIK